MNFWVWFSQVPAVAYVGVLGFVGTTLTIYFNNKATADRLRRQVIEDRKTDGDARLFSARRDVYLAAADVAALGMSLIGQLSDYKRSTADIVKPFVEAAGDLAKAHLFASLSTSQAILQVAAGIGASIVELTLKRLEIDELTIKINAATPEDRASGTEARLQVERLHKLIPFAEECMIRVALMAPLLAKALTAIRNDLSVHHNEVAFEDLIVTQANNQRDHLVAAFKPLRARFGIGPQPPPPSPLKPT